MKIANILMGAVLMIAPICANPASGGEASPAELRIGGALRFNYFLKSWEGEEANRERGGDLAFDTFRINVDASKSSVDLSLEYRVYAGYHMLHHGYVGTTTEGGTNWYLGVHRKPFGLLPFSSNNWFFNITYYLGMEDDADAGLGVRIPLNNTTIDIAFFKNDEGSFTGSSIASARYSYDIVHTDDGELGYAGLVGSRSNRETNQGNIRLAHLFGESDSRSLEAGISAEYGGLYNSVTAQTGHHQAVAVHADGRMGKFRLMLEAIEFKFAPKNPAGQDDDFVENAELEAARNELSFLEGRIQDLEDILNNYQLIVESSDPHDSVRVGDWITVVEDGFDEDERYHLVGPAEADPTGGRISVESPLGKALLGAKVGDSVKVNAPNGLLEFKIVAIG